MQYDYDILIAGGGLAGNCLALALKDSGLKLAIIEAQTPEQLKNSPAGDRALALAAGTVNMLKTLGVWQHTHSATPIKHIHISDRGHFGKTRLNARQHDVDALGYVIAARELESCVADQVEQAGIRRFCPARVVGLMAGQEAVHVSLKQQDNPVALSAALLVGADGGQSSVRKLLDIPQQITQYGQTALVTTVRADRPHQNTAFERFTESGPLALLPVQDNQLSVVWTRTHEDAKALMADSEDVFLAQLQDCFGYRLGQLHLTAPRRAFPLTLIRAERMTDRRVILIGNAVHQLHPVAGQGFNLGLRDVVQLAELLQQQTDPGSAEILQHYADQRQLDHDKTIAFTNNTVKIFSNSWLALAAARNAGLTLLDHLPFAKNLLAQHAMGLAERQPRIGSKR